MPNYKKYEDDVLRLAQYIDGRIEMVTGATQKAQNLIYKRIQELVLRFEIKEGHYVSGQDLTRQLLQIENNIKKVLFGKEYSASIKTFLADLTKIQTKTINLHKSINELEVKIASLVPARQIIYDQAKTTLLNSGAIAQNYIDPMKRLIASNVLQARSIIETVKMLEQWNDGTLSSGRLNRGMPAPNLQRYATQMARDSAYAVQRTTNEIIKEHYGLKKFIYVGSLVEASRPLCVHLVAMNRPIALDEIPELIVKYPDGLYPGTNKDNFISNCGGYGCRHICLSVHSEMI